MSVGPSGKVNSFSARGIISGILSKRQSVYDWSVTPEFSYPTKHKQCQQSWHSKILNLSGNLEREPIKTCFRKVCKLHIVTSCPCVATSACCTCAHTHEPSFNPLLGLLFLDQTADMFVYLVFLGGSPETQLLSPHWSLGLNWLIWLVRWASPSPLTGPCVSLPKLHAQWNRTRSSQQRTIPRSTSSWT